MIRRSILQNNPPVAPSFNDQTTKVAFWTILAAILSVIVVVVDVYLRSPA